MKIHQHIITWSGAFLILVGVALVIAQMFIQVNKPETHSEFASRSLNLQAPGAKAAVQTTYVGLVMIVVGAGLEVVGFVSARPWRQKPNADD
jgi:uncharacterized membrane protein